MPTEEEQRHIKSSTISNHICNNLSQWVFLSALKAPLTLSRAAPALTARRLSPDHRCFPVGSL